MIVQDFPDQTEFTAQVNKGGEPGAQAGMMEGAAAAAAAAAAAVAVAAAHACTCVPGELGMAPSVHAHARVRACVRACACVRASVCECARA